MVVKNFRASAFKHFVTCEHLLSAETARYRSEIYLCAYYLSGYVLECIFKYLYLECNHKKNVTEDELHKYGLHHHKLDVLYHKIANELQLDHKMPSKLPTTYNQWNTEIRYNMTGQNNDFIKDFRRVFKDFVKPTFNSIYNKY